MKTPAELRALTIEGLTRIVDPELFPLGFKRSPKGLKYLRTEGTSTQKIACTLQMRPSGPTRYAYFYPHLALLDGPTKRAAVLLLGSIKRYLAFDLDSIIGLPLKWLEPKIKDRHGWLYENAEQCEKAMKDFVKLLFGRAREMLECTRTAQEFFARLDTLEPFIDRPVALCIAGGLWLRGDAKQAEKWVKRAHTQPEHEPQILAALKNPPPAELVAMLSAPSAAPVAKPARAAHARR